MKQQLTRDGRREHTCSQATQSVFAHWLCHHITPPPPPKITGWGTQSEVRLGKPWNPLKGFPSRAGQKAGYQSCQGGEPRVDTPAGIGARTGMDRVETHSRWFTGPMLYQLATAPGSQKVKLYFEASKNWGMLFTFPLEISEDRKHTDEGFTGVGGWQGRRVSSVIRCHEREVWGPPYPCSQTAWKPVLRVPPAGAQT